MINKLTSYNGKIISRGGELIKKQQSSQLLMNIENANSIELKDLGLVDLGNGNFLDFNGTYSYTEDDNNVAFVKNFPNGSESAIRFFSQTNIWVMGYDNVGITHICQNGDINNLPLTGWFINPEISPELQTFVSSILINSSEIHADVVNQLSETNNTISILIDLDSGYSGSFNVIIKYVWLGSDVIIFDGSQSFRNQQTYEIPDNVVGYVEINTGSSTSWVINGQPESHGPAYINENVNDNLNIQAFISLMA